MRHRHAGALLIGTEAKSDEARRLDAADPLAHFAAEFHHPVDAAGRRLLYLCGHSLGLQPKAAAAMVAQELADWQRLGVEGHFHGTRPWLSYHERLSAPLAALCGAHEAEVVAMNSLTVNLHLLMASFYRPQGERRRLLIERAAFPSDRYAMLSQLQHHGLDASLLVELTPRAGEDALRTEDVLDAIEREGPALALALLPGVQYLTGQALELAPLIEATRRVGAIAGLDLAHAIGNLPLKLHDWNADFAVWCSYKYLNGGPGAIGGCFVHERHSRGRPMPRLAGWWGHDKAARFRFEPDFVPMPGAQGWQVSNPPILSSAPLLASLEQFGRAGIGPLRKKSLGLTGLLRRQIEARMTQHVQIITPAADPAHGCQLSLRLRRIEQAQRCRERLTAAGLVVDWREPDVLRIAPVPLYNSYAEVMGAADVLEAALGP